MAVDKRHEVRVNVRVLELSKAGSGIELEVFAEGEKLGEIEIGHGSFGSQRRAASAASVALTGRRSPPGSTRSWTSPPTLAASL
jgi:hypothetical protein